MPTTHSLVTAVSHPIYNNLMADDGVVARVREGQTAVCTAFGSLSIPAGSTIDGIRIFVEGYTTHATFGEDCFSVSNDGGSSFSTEQNVTTEPWSTSSGAHLVETAGGTSELWGKTWNATTAAAIQVQIKVDSAGHAFYLDYVQMEITYTEGLVVVPKSLTINGVATINGQLTIK